MSVKSSSNHAKMTADLSGMAPETVEDMYSNMKVVENRFISKFKDYTKPMSFVNSSMRSSSEDFNPQSLS